MGAAGEEDDLPAGGGGMAGVHMERGQERYGPDDAGKIREDKENPAERVVSEQEPRLGEAMGAYERWSAGARGDGRAAEGTTGAQGGQVVPALPPWCGGGRGTFLVTLSTMGRAEG